MSTFQNESRKFLSPVDEYATLSENVVFAVALNFLWTGLGHFYIKRIVKGIALSFVSLFLSVLTFIMFFSDASLTILFVLVGVAYWIWGMFDVYKEGKRLEAKRDDRSVEIDAAQFASEIEKLYRLRKADLVSNTEYELEKEKLISQLKYRQIAQKQDFLLGVLKLLEKGYISQQDVDLIKTAIGKS